MDLFEGERSPGTGPGSGPPGFENFKIIEVIQLPAVPAVRIKIRYLVTAACITTDWVPRPAIDGDIWITIEQYDEYNAPAYTITGDHDLFPWHELYLNGLPPFEMPFDVCVAQTSLVWLIDTGFNKHVFNYGGQYYPVP